MLQSHFHPRFAAFGERSARFDCGRKSWEIGYRAQDDTLTLESLTGDGLSFQLLHQLLDRLWGRVAANALQLAPALAEELPIEPRYWQCDDEGLCIERPAFYQIREAWLAPALWPVMPQIDVAAPCPGGRHPRRPRVADGLLYQKYLPATGELFELRRAEVARDGELFHRWQNQPRVAAFWEEARSREELDAYLQRQRDDAHAEPLIGYIDGQPFAYIQTYWAREDRIAPYYDADDYDHGFHLLVGEPRFLGGRRTAGWLRAVSHYLFLLDPRTQRLVGEPRADNRALLRQVPRAGWRKIREFDFPHKRAALVMCERATFFGEMRL